MKYTKDQQIRHVVEGLALGVLANGVEAVTSGKMTQEFAFNYAWRRWSKVSNFSSIGGHDPGNLIWIGIGKSKRRRGARAAWARDRWSWPYITMDNWTVQDCLELHADERASIADWIELGGLYVERFKDDEKLVAGA
jgi:hypothetical protein